MLKLQKLKILTFLKRSFFVPRELFYSSQMVFSSWSVMFSWIKLMIVTCKAVQKPLPARIEAVAHENIW